MYPECSLYHYQISITLSDFSVFIKRFTTLALVSLLFVLLLPRFAMSACTSKAKSAVCLPDTFLI